jgi:hypothetical protein
VTRLGNHDCATSCSDRFQNARRANSGIEKAVVTQSYQGKAIPAEVPISVQINSTSARAIDGSYAFDTTTQAKMLAVILYIQQNGKFPGGLLPFPWPDANGTMHMFATTAQFQSLATALADYVTALTPGQTPAMPLAIPERDRLGLEIDRNPRWHP